MLIKYKREKLANTCGKWWAVLHYETDTIKEISRVNIKCNSWLCPTCAKKRAKKFAAGVTRLFKDDKKISLFTLTLDRSKNLQDSYRHINKSWNRLRTVMTKHFGKLKYVRVLEPHKDGYPHVHVLIDKYIPSGFLNTHVAKAGFGKIYKIKKLSNRDAFFYVLKYLKKDWQNEKALQVIVDYNIRRCNGSRGFTMSVVKDKRWTLLTFQSSDSSSLDCILDFVQAYSENDFVLSDSRGSPGYALFSLTWDVEQKLEHPDENNKSAVKRFDELNILSAFDSPEKRNGAALGALQTLVMGCSAPGAHNLTPSVGTPSLSSPIPF